jgi:hypothetical protein
MATQEQVLHAHRDHPKWTDLQIAKHLDCSAGYVRRSAQRLNIVLPGRRGDSISALGNAAREAGMTLADIAAWEKAHRKGDHQ